ncbi:MAG TPA: AzlC family ABC transporter permease [Anaerolineae bacterium]|nr:AzlC family ABC transporter permease [Anaerolineae bacterium]
MELIQGMLDQLPILLGVVPFGLIFGALAVSFGIPPLLAQGFSLFIFAGSAQFIAAGLVAEGAPPIVVVLTILVVNLRHVLYSANLAPHFSRLPGRWKIVLSWLLTDEAFAVTSVRYQKNPSRHTHWYMLGTGMILWSSWQVSTTLGIAVGASIPPGWSLDFALPLTFMALLTPTLIDRPAWAAALSAGLLSVLSAGLPYKLNLLIGAVCGVALGLALEMRQERQASGEGAGP